MTKIIILGSGAAPGVPSLSNGWGNCNPNNPYNRRRRTGTYYDFASAKILVDTSPDLRLQLLDNNIRYLDAVLYTHAHADHLHGIDYLREINRINKCNLDFYATAKVSKTIKNMFGYLITSPKKVKDVVSYPSLVANKIKCGKEFLVGDVKIVPLKLDGHNTFSNGYMFNDGEIVHLADFKRIPDSTLKLLQKKHINLMIMPLTLPEGSIYHVGLNEVLEYIRILQPQKVVLNHMASECDFDEINALTPDNVFPAYDNMIIEL